MEINGWCKNTVKRMMRKMLERQALHCNWGFWCVYEGRLYKLYIRKGHKLYPK